MGGSNLTIVNSSARGDTLNIQINTDKILPAQNNFSYDLKIKKGDILTLNTSQTNYIQLDAKKIADDFEALDIIVDANGIYTDTYASQALGVTNTLLPYTANNKSLFMSFNPPYFITLTGAAPGVMTQYDGSKYLYNPDDPPNSTSNIFIIVLIAIVMIILVIVLGTGAYMYRKHKITKI